MFSLSFFSEETLMAWKDMPWDEDTDGLLEDGLEKITRDAISEYLNNAGGRPKKENRKRF